MMRRGSAFLFPGASPSVAVWSRAPGRSKTEDGRRWKEAGFWVQASWKDGCWADDGPETGESNGSTAAKRAKLPS